MATTQYEVYRANTIALAKTMIVKHSAIADAINVDLSSRYAVSGGDPKYYVDSADPTTWKYYLNLAGQYHVTDTPMQVISQDTLQTIDFTVANLQLNTATAAAYAPGGRYYSELVSKYPTQELLIRGILNPTPLNKSIGVDDGTILWFDRKMVESNEYSLIYDLQNWITTFLRRWYTPDYAQIDDLYFASVLGVMFMSMPSIILGLRLKYCHTYQAHSYHITQFLASHGKLDAYASSLTKPQMLWLYRNIRYIQRNAGQQRTFQTLIDNLLTPRNLPLLAWDMKHDITTLQNDLAPQVIFQREALNLATSDEGVETIGVPTMLTKELVAAPGNSNGALRIADVTNTLTWGLGNAYDTKVLESSVLDTTDAAPYRLTDCLLNHWLYYAALGTYRAVVSVPDPLTGDMYTFGMLDAFLVYTYAFSASKNLLDPDTAVPTVYANKVLKRPIPNSLEISNLVDLSVVSQEDLQAIYTNAPTVPAQFLSITSFNKTVRSIHNYELYQHALFSTQGHLWRRAYLETATLYCWVDYEVNLTTPGTTYRQWFTERGLDILQLNSLQLSILADGILTAATGADLTVSESLADVQRAMLGIMTQLSSYSVQYLRTINSGTISVIERASIRLGDTQVVAGSDDKIIIPMSEIIGGGGGGISSTENLVPADVSSFNWGGIGGGSVTVSSAFSHVTKRTVEGRQKVPLVAVGLMSMTDDVDTDISHAVVTDSQQYQPTGLQALPAIFTGLTLSFYQVSPSDQTAMQDRYNAYITANGLPVAQLSDYIQVTTIPPFWTPPV